MTKGGIFDQLCFSLASLVYALSLDEYNAETLFVAETLDLEADLALKRKATTPRLQSKWADVGRLMMNADSKLHQELIFRHRNRRYPLRPAVHREIHLVSAMDLTSLTSYGIVAFGISSALPHWSGSCFHRG